VNVWLYLLGYFLGRQPIWYAFYSDFLEQRKRGEEDRRREIWNVVCDNGSLLFGKEVVYIGFGFKIFFVLFVERKRYSDH
jgi:hypothetical protein